MKNLEIFRCVKFTKVYLLRFIFPLIICIYYSPINVIAQSGWIYQNSGTSSNLFSVRFLNETTGWVCGESGLILKTTNGGENWINIGYGNTLLRAIHFIDENTGVIVGGDFPPPMWGSPTQIIIRTTNGGINWNTLMNNYGRYFTNVQFVNDSVGFIGFDGVYKSTNKGTNWEHFGNTVNENCFFINENTGYAGNALIQTIQKSTNGGINWINLLNPGSHDFGGDVFFCNEQTGYVTGAHNIIKTTDAGSSWQNIWNDYYFRNKGGMFFSDSEHGVILAYSNFPSSYFIQSTTNGGINWNINYSPIWLRSVFFLNNMTGWIVGNMGKILKTTSGGITYVNQTLNAVPEDFLLHQNYPNPFNPSTNIKFEIPSSLHVVLKLFSITGKEIATLVNEFLNAGIYNVNFNGSTIASGIYFYRIQTEKFTAGKFMILLK